MDLGDLSASELARIDSICLEYESELRAGESPPIDQWVAQHGGQHADLLRRELSAIRDEILTAPPKATPSTVTQTGAVETRIDLPSAGTVVGPYMLREMLGRGGMGVVYRAIDQRLDREVAIKMLAVDAAKRRDLSERFEREAKAVAALSHPNIVELFDIGISGGLPYAVMEYLDGQLLDQRFKQGAMDAGEVRRLGAQIADALAAAHDGDVIHRDLKPHNIMLVRRQGGQPTGGASEAAESTIVKLFDFGLSRVPRGEMDVADETGEGIVLGTPGYMAPEQARGESVTSKADLFSLGCVLYEAFYGARAFDATTTAARFRSTIEDSPQPDPIRRRDDLALAELIEQCLQKDAGDRPASAAVVAARLRRKEPDADPITQQIDAGYAAGTITRRRVLALTGGAIAGGLTGGILAQRQGRLDHIRSLAVLSFHDDTVDAKTGSTPAPTMAQPVGERDLHRGEKLSALLVHELTRLSELTIPRFRPMEAETPKEFRSIGTELEVDALLTGSIRTVSQGTSPFQIVDIQLISAETGNQLWGKQLQTDAADNYLHQSKVATEIALAIGHRLTSTADEDAPPSVESFSCLVDGKTRSDPESVAGLVKALKCFEHAHQVDRRFADPLAGIALTSVTLAAQSPDDQSLELIIRAREAAAEALMLDPASIDARLATAMLDWQTTNRYQQAQRSLRELSMIAPNNWQVLHQHGLLQLALADFAGAAKSLREAAQLNPWSVLAKVDRARALWFSGNDQRAINEATRIRDKYDQNRLARGLLVDIFEQLQRFDDAIDQHDQLQLKEGYSETQYWQARAEQVDKLPYGPFGETMNRAILKTRLPDGIDDLNFAEIADSTPPALPLLLAAHPSFSAVRLLDRAKEILPELRSQ